MVEGEFQCINIQWISKGKIRTLTYPNWQNREKYCGEDNTLSTV
jgi:hypothetical protein